MKLYLSLLAFAFKFAVCNATSRTLETNNFVNNSAEAPDEAPNYTPPLATGGLLPGDDGYEKIAIEGQYIILFTDKQNPMTKSETLIGDKSKILWLYDAAFKGVTVQNIDDALLAKIKADPEVIYVEQVSILYRFICLYFFSQLF
jgi:hypothetical protein